MVFGKYYLAYHSPSSGPKASLFHMQNTFAHAKFPTVSIHYSFIPSPKFYVSLNQNSQSHLNHLSQVWVSLWTYSILGHNTLYCLKFLILFLRHSEKGKIIELLNRSVFARSLGRQEHWISET